MVKKKKGLMGHCKCEVGHHLTKLQESTQVFKERNEHKETKNILSRTKKKNQKGRLPFILLTKNRSPILENG